MPANAQADQGPNPALEGHPLVSAQKVSGAAVYDQKGEKLGQIEDVMLHKISGRVAYAVMAYGGFLGVGERYHPLPWSILTWDPERQGYVVPLERTQLEGAPALAQDELSDSDEAWRDRVHSHFQAAPYWM